MSNRRTSSQASQARIAAFEIGSMVRSRQAFTQEVIAAYFSKVQIDPIEKAYATRLALGVTTCQGTLDEILDRHLKNPGNLQPEVRDALRISTYETIFLGKDPYAAVHQGVELLKGISPKAAGLANAILRKVVLDKDTFPFGDPLTDIDALARLYAFPTWLAKLLVKDRGFNEARMFMAASNEPAPLFVAENRVMVLPTEVASLFDEKGIAFSEVAVAGELIEGCYRMIDRQACLSSTLRELLEQGKVLVCDAASQIVVKKIMPSRLPQTFLEIGSGRGNKTILLQSEAMSRFGEQMLLTSLDKHGFKTNLLQDRLKAYGVSYAGLYTHDARDMGSLFKARSFDNVFIDAPCSGLGTLRRHPEIRWRITSELIGATAQLALSLLKGAAPFVKLGGELAYSTCTVIKKENELVIEKFLASEEGRDFTVDPIDGQQYFRTELTVGSPDAHFASRLVRRD